MRSKSWSVRFCSLMTMQCPCSNGESCGCTATGSKLKKPHGCHDHSSEPNPPHVQLGEEPPLPAGSTWGLSRRSCCLQQCWFFALQHFRRCAVKEGVTFSIQAGFTHSILLATSGRLQPAIVLLGHYNTLVALPRKRTVAPWPQAVILLGISLLKTWSSSCAKQAVDTQRGAASLLGIYPDTSLPLISDQSLNAEAKLGLNVRNCILIPYMLCHTIRNHVFILKKKNAKANHKHD